MFAFQFSREFKNRKIKRPPPDIEPNEILLDKLAKRKEEEFGISEKKLETPLLKIVLQGLLLFSFLIIFLLFAKTFQLQILDHQKFTALAESNKYILRSIQAERGVIYDRNLKQLVFNKPSFDLVLEKVDFLQLGSQKKKVLTEVSQILKLSATDLEKKIAESEAPQVLIAENLDHQTLIILETKKFPGFRVVNAPVREYPEGENFSHLIGYTGKIRPEELKNQPQFYSIEDYVGRDGLESSYEEILRKNPGKMRIERDALGNIISKEIIQMPESGKSLVLWLDSDLQKKIREVLEKQRQALGAKGAAAVALYPKTGGVLALVSLPDFDNNLFQKGAHLEKLQALFKDPLKLTPLFNRAISGRYPTGSTIKPLIALAALEEKIISPEKKIYAGGFIEIPHQYNPEIIYKFKDWAIHGWTDLRKAIAQSVNVYFYTIGGGYKDQKGLGPTKIKEYLELFGWTEKTGIDLPGEKASFVPDREWKKRVLGEGWWDGDTYNLSIGQGFLQITPLAVANSFAAIANGGKLFQPQVVKEIIDQEKKIIEKIEPKIIRENFIDPAYYQIVREGMRQAVTGENSPLASATLLNSLPVSAAAKTGTAEIGKGYYHHWVTVFAPYEDPEIVLTIMIENVKGVQAAALPVASKVLQWYFSRP